MDYDRSFEDIELDTMALDEAIGAGKLNEVLRCIPLVDPAYLPKSLWWASACGFESALKALMQVCDPKIDNSRALCAAAVEGHIECVRLLLPVSNPQDYSLALFEAVLTQEQEIVDLLCPVSNLDDAIFRLQRHPYQYPHLKESVEALEEYKAHKQHQILMGEVGVSQRTRCKKM